MYGTIIVTCYYLIKSKHTPSQYRQWMSNMLQHIHSPMLIFTDKDTRALVESFREKLMHLTHIVEISFENFLTANYSLEWLAHHNMDPERWIHTIPLYMIWAEKSNFLKKATEMNPFQSEYFLWCDIGCFRDETEMYKYHSWPSTELIAQNSMDNKILLTVVENFEPHENEETDFTAVNRIGGTIFGGNKRAVEQWFQFYYETLEDYFKVKRFAGKDQSIMATMALKYPNMVHLITPPKNHDWFYFQNFLNPTRRFNKICIIGPGCSPIPPVGWGACEIIIWDYACILKKYGYEVHIVNEKDPQKILQKIDYLEPDVVHIQYDDFAYLAHQLKAKLILLTTHFAYLQQPSKWSGYQQIFNYTKTLPDNAYIFCLSEAIRKVYFGHVRQDHLIVQGNGARDDLFCWTQEPKYPDRTICVGKIEPRKGQYLLTSDSSIYFAGNIQTYCPINRNNYLGEWSKDSLYQELTNYANLVLLSDGEADPLVVKEALMAGLGLVISPEAAANLDTSKEWIDIVPREKWNDAIYMKNVVENNRKKSLKKRSEIRQYAMEHFSWENLIIEQYIPKVEKILTNFQ